VKPGLGRAIRLVAPFGFYGAGNIGDESTLQGFARLVGAHGRDVRLTVASRNPRHTARVEPAFKYYSSRGFDMRGAWACRRAAAHVIVGGTPIMDVLGGWPFSELLPLVEWAACRGKPVVFLGTGTEHLHREESRRFVREVLAPRVQRWSVRSQADEERLTSYGVAADQLSVAADLAWLLDPVASDRGRSALERLGIDKDERLLGVNLTNERFVAEADPELPSKLAMFLDAAIDKHDVRVLFLANEVRDGESFDRMAGARVRERMARRDRVTEVPAIYRTPQEMMSIIACCAVTLSMRYHFCLFSALQRVPFIAINRSDKVVDLGRDLVWPYTCPLSGVRVADLRDMLAELLDTSDAARSELGKKSEWMRQRAMTNDRALEGLLAG
jgi:polysaccharide pyruvyl transferase WcaK-like protein